MEVDVFNMKGKKVSTAELSAAIFEAPVKIDLMHQAFVRQMANARAGTHSTKGRSEVSGGGRKPWRQKGTGRARQGSIRAAQWVGGGKIFTPKPRSYNKDMPKKMRRAALRSALSVKASEGEIVLVDEFKLDEGRTKEMAEVLQNLARENTVLVLIPDNGPDYEVVRRTGRNLDNAKILLASYLNIRDLLGYESLVIPVAALDVIESYLG
ncbi:MAG: 50S ribosomal protein L4 [Chloroflexota bacterium]|jgi:large subunit ribosomal protein L4|nr:50S ribosomal protein L4 [Chloroflexota bacterium]